MLVAADEDGTPGTGSTKKLSIAMVPLPAVNANFQSVRVWVVVCAEMSFRAFVVPTQISALSSATVSSVPSGALYVNVAPELLMTQRIVWLPLKFALFALAPKSLNENCPAVAVQFKPNLE